jgi:hypothetical protein
MVRELLHMHSEIILLMSSEINKNFILDPDSMKNHQSLESMEMQSIIEI